MKRLPAETAENKFLDFARKNTEPLAAAAITLLAIMIRNAGFDFKSHDYNAFIHPWIRFLKENGNFFGIKSVASDYTVPSLILYSLISYLPEKLLLWAVKIVSCGFDFITAAFGGKIVYFLTKSRGKAAAGYFFILFCPTIFLNSGFWGQTDGIFTAFLVVSLYCFLKEKTRMSLFWFGLGLSFKLQAVFVLPFFVIMYFYKKWTMPQITHFAAGFFALNAPMWIFGIPLLKWAKVYLFQINEYSAFLVLNAPTIYALIPNSSGRIGIILLFALLAVFLFYVLHSNSKSSKETELLIFLMCSCTVPFLLPHMHERYFYIAEVITIIYVVYNPKSWPLGILIIFPSVITYAKYMYGENFFPLQILALIMGAGVILLWKNLFRSIGNDIGRSNAALTTGRK